MKQYILLAVIFYSTLSYAGSINLDFPKFANQTVKIYYSEGNHTDSLSTTLNAVGRVEVLLDRIEPRPYGGMMRLFIPDNGGIEFIGGEKELKIVCRSDVIDKETVSFPSSLENNFLYETFNRKSQLMEQQGWLMAGSRFYKPDSDIAQLLKRETETTEDNLKQLDDSVSHSSLYAARFLEWADFMNRLFEAEQSRNPEKASIIQNEMETTADIESLYYSGQLWSNVHNYYISMFNRIDRVTKQSDYAASINKTAQRLTGNIREGFFAGAIKECERFGWSKAEEIVLQNMASIYPVGTKFNDGNLERLIGMQHTMPGNAAPVIVGIQNTAPQQSRRLIIFYESGCSNCENEMQQLINNYSVLKEKGIEVISISADNDKTVFEYHSKDFPWQEKLYDSKGFEGENFKNYGVIGVPTFYMVDENGIIQGKYAKLVDTGIL